MDNTKNVVDSWSFYLFLFLAPFSAKERHLVISFDTRLLNDYVVVCFDIQLTVKVKTRESHLTFSLLGFRLILLSRSGQMYRRA
jgi:hypothetical protein